MSKYSIKTGENGIELVPDSSGYTIEQIQKVLLPHYTTNQIINLIKK